MLYFTVDLKSSEKKKQSHNEERSDVNAHQQRFGQSFSHLGFDVFLCAAFNIVVVVA